MATILIEGIRDGAEFVVRRQGNRLHLETPDHTYSLAICLDRFGSDGNARRCHPPAGLGVGSVVIELEPLPPSLLLYRVSSPQAQDLVDAVRAVDTLGKEGPP